MKASILSRGSILAVGAIAATTMLAGPSVPSAHAAGTAPALTASARCQQVPNFTATVFTNRRALYRIASIHTAFGVRFTPWRRNVPGKMAFANGAGPPLVTGQALSYRFQVYAEWRGPRRFSTRTFQFRWRDTNLADRVVLAGPPNGRVCAMV